MQDILKELGRRLRQRSALRGIIGFLVAISIFTVGQGDAALDALAWAFDAVIPFVQDVVIPAFLPGGVLYALYEAFRDEDAETE